MLGLADPEHIDSSDWSAA